MKTTKLNTLIFGLLLAGVNNVKAQDEKYIVLDKKALKEIKKPVKSPLLVENDHVFKFDPTRMLVGEIGFSYERVRGINSSFEFEIGPTISNLYGYNNHFYYNYNFPSYYATQSGLGIFGSVGYRYYPHHDALNGFYVSTKLKYKTLNTEYIDHSGVLPNERGVKNQYSFIFNMGYQVWLSKSFSMDLYGGIGIGYVYNEQMNYSSVYNSTTMLYESTWIKEKYQGANLVFNLGVKVGIGSILKK